MDRRTVDKLELYRWAVQDPETHAIVLATMYERLRAGRQPLILREDFAGTSAESVAWIALRRGRQAIAVDLDEQALAWAQRRADRLLGPRAAEVRFVQGDVRSIGPPELPFADIISVLNFSILYLCEIAELQSYLRQARAGLSQDGILVLNLFGGPECVRPGSTSRRVIPNPRLPGEQAVPEFDYIWEVRSFDPVRERLDCRIHFAIPNDREGSPIHEMRDAFRYDWRLWSVIELADALLGAGFSDVQLWRHTYDPALGDSGVFLGSVDPRSLQELEHWTAYLVACR